MSPLTSENETDGHVFYDGTAWLLLRTALTAAEENDLLRRVQDEGDSSSSTCSTSTRRRSVGASVDTSVVARSRAVSKVAPMPPEGSEGDDGGDDEAAAGTGKGSVHFAEQPAATAASTPAPPPAAEKTDTPAELFKDFAKMTSADKIVLVQRPLMSNTMLRCVVERDRSSRDTMYSMYLDDGSRTLLMASIRRKDSRTSNYPISVSKTAFVKTARDAAGKVRSLASSRKAFTVYSIGDNPQRGVSDPSTLRRELATVMYTNESTAGLPYKMQIAVPLVKAGEEPAIWQPRTVSQTLHEHLRQGVFDGLLLLESKAPVFHKATNSYSLDFGGRARRTSLKNFQVVPKGQPDRILMQFGRIDDERFCLDFRFPLSPIQALGISITRFDTLYL